MSPLDADIGDWPPAEAGIDAELGYFLRHVLVSGLALRVLLLVRRAPATEWRPQSVAAAVGARAFDAASALARLEREGLIACTDHGYLYAPRSPRLEHLSERLGRLCGPAAQAAVEPLLAG